MDIGLDGNLTGCLLSTFSFIHGSIVTNLKTEDFMVDYPATDRGMLWLFSKLHLGQRGVQVLKMC